MPRATDATHQKRVISTLPRIVALSVLVYDRTQEVTRSSWAEPQAREGDVTLGLSPAGEGQMAVTVSARFGATYTDRYRNLPFDGRCRSTGELERALLQAAAGA